MKKFRSVFFYVYLLLGWYFVSSCAKIGSPSGGPKDTIPPILLESYPTNGSVFFKEKKIKLVFNERIQVGNLKKELIITPFKKRDFNFSVKKNQLELKFENDFEENTTFLFNFRDGIKDITEGNPAKNLILAFSTGAFIDSISISGNVKELLTNEPVNEVLVGLYSYSDSLEFSNDIPTYFIKTNQKGSFSIENVKEGIYKLFVFIDENDNLLHDNGKEAQGFLSETVSLIKPKDSIELFIQKIDTRPLSLKSATAVGQYYDLKFNKGILRYEVIFPNSNTDTLLYNLKDQNKSIRFYPNNTIKDSIKVFISAVDSVFQSFSDTLFVKLQETKRKADSFESIVSPKNNSSVNKNFKGKVIFNKPVLSTHYDSIYFQYDTLYKEIFTPNELNWNKTKDEVSFHKTLNIDSITSLVQQDSVKKDGRGGQPKTTGVLYLGKGAFLSIENDSSKKTITNYSFSNDQEFGTIKGNINTDHKSFTIQLLNEKMEVVQEIKNEKSYIFSTILPGKYKIRVLIDLNNNGDWEPGNPTKNIEHEPVIFYNKTLTVRANWDLEKIDLSF